ncbi:hypothetical protein J6Q66_01215 [bacterium]|nr:hypothetical protein [bacterium]
MKQIFCIYKQRILSAIVIPFVTGLIFSFFTIGNTQEYSLMLSFFRLFHYANDIKSITPMVLTATPYLVLLCSLTGIFTDDLKIQATYCFSRKKNITNWYISRIGLLSLLSVICVIVFFITGSTIIFIFSKDSVINLLTNFAIWKMLFVVCLYVFSFAFLINTFSLVIKKKYIFPITALIIFVFSSLIPYSAASENKILLIINPMVHINAELHCDILPLSFLETISDTDWSFLGISFQNSCIYFCIVGVIAFTIGILIVNHIDIAFKEED